MLKKIWKYDMYRYKLRKVMLTVLILLFSLFAPFFISFSSFFINQVEIGNQLNDIKIFKILKLEVRRIYNLNYGGRVSIKTNNEVIFDGFSRKMKK